MNIQFTIAEWAAWAPGLETAEAWQAWAREPFVPMGDGTPALSEVPAMQRRRIDRLGRMAIQAAYWCQRAEAEGIPFVFASRHGDVACSVQLLEALSRREALSPTSFGLSVHNAIAALYSIVRGERGNYLALAAGQATPEAALVEAAGLLGDGAPEVLVVVYDAALPEVYADFGDEPDPFHAWCWRVAPVDREGFRVSLACGAASESAPGAVTGLPHGLEVLRFLLAAGGPLRHHEDARQWEWRHGG
nr:beta-ketoacyl synthase chain length factor [Pseudoxanthomonas sp.]